MQSSTQQDPLTLITLVNQYDILLQDYDTQTAQLTAQGSAFKQLPGRAWWGTQILDKRTNIKSANDCEQWCHSNTRCSGATFNPTQNGGTCTIVSGNAASVVINDDTTAIIKSQYDKINNMIYTNQQLSDMNLQIVALCQADPLDSVGASLVANQTQRLNQQRDRLNQELAQLKKAQQQIGQKKSMVDTAQMDKEYLRAHVLIGLAALAVVITAYRLI
jgi:hypothetical protein